MLIIDLSHKNTSSNVTVMKLVRNINEVYLDKTIQFEANFVEWIYLCIDSSL